jgi:SAM-dependent methyltransferase
MTPENFDKHWRGCECVFWKWFQSLGIAKDIRRVLDVGCGSGYTTEHFLRYGFDVTGVTVNPHEKAECVQRGVRVLESDFHFLPENEDIYDLVFSSHSLEHSSVPLFALWEWKRVLRPGGYLFLVVPLMAEQDARAIFPEHYIPDVDAMNFTGTSDKLPSYAEMCTAASAYGATLHVIVPSYWQVCWLLEIAGFEKTAEAIEAPASNEIMEMGTVDGRRPRDPTQVVNGMFLLRKPQSLSGG